MKVKMIDCRRSFTLCVCVCMKSEKVKVFVTQSCLTLCDTTDYSLSGSSVHGIL